MERYSEREAWGRVGFGVDIQGDRLVVVRAERGRKGVALTAARADAPTLRAAPLAAALGPRESITLWLEVAFGARAKALKVLPTVLDIQLPFAIEQCAYEFPVLLRTAEGRTRALGVAARVVDVERRLARLAEAGLDPVVLDHEGLALWAHSAAEMPGAAAGADAVRVVAYRGVDRATLAIGVGGEYRCTHAVRLDDAAQVRRLIRAAAGEGARTVTWWWAGPGADDPLACEALIEGLRQEWTCTAATHREPATFLARALASRLVTVGPWRCNLRAGRLEHPAAAGVRARGKARAMAVALVAGLLLCGVNVSVSALLRARTAAFDDAFRECAEAVAGRALGAAKGEQAMLVARRQVASQRAATEPYRHYVNLELRQAVRTIMAAAAAAKLNVETLSVKPGRVVVTGRGNGWESATPLARSLETAGLKSTITREEPLPDTSVPFSLTAEAGHE